MGQAYRCDGCKEFFEGEPRWTLEGSYQTYSEPSEWLFHTTGCIIIWASEHAKRA